MNSFYLVIGVLFVRLSHHVNGDGCPPGIFGPSCIQKCGHCLGGNSFCHSETGICRDGCSSGYDGDTCHVTCKDGTYGLGCGKTCPKNCKKQECDPVDGSCLKVGCKSGFAGRFCTERCPGGTYGPNCSLACRCAEGCMCDSHGTCLSEGCKHKAEKKKRKVRQAQQKKKTSGKKAASGLMCSKMQQTFTELKEKLNRRVEVSLGPIVHIMIIACLVILVVGFIQMVLEFKREMYVRKWERENILQPLQLRSKEQEEELMRAIEESDEPPKKKFCTIQ